MHARLLTIASVTILAICALSGDALAYDGAGFVRFGYSVWADPPAGDERSDRRPRYFTMHVPVYDGCPLSPTYGDSQFLNVQVFVMEEEGPKPLRIVNPFVAKPGDPGVSPEAVMPRPAQVVHPAAVSAGR
jgi:hypothetical protein